MLCQETIHADPAAAIPQPSVFIGAPLNGVLLQLRLDHTSVDCMRSHALQFDEDLVHNPPMAAACHPATLVGSRSAVTKPVGMKRYSATPCVRR